MPEISKDIKFANDESSEKLLTEVQKQREQQSRELAEDIAKSKRPYSEALIRNVQGDTENRRDVKDYGIIDVKVDDLPWPEKVKSPADFNHNITWPDAVTATKKLPEIQRGVKAGKTGDDFSAEDEAAGTPHEQGKRRVYELYYGSQPVKVTKTGDSYDIDGGHHRIFAAKYFGLETMPARVEEIL